MVWGSLFEYLVFFLVRKMIPESDEVSLCRKA